MFFSSVANRGTDHRFSTPFAKRLKWLLPTERMLARGLREIDAFAYEVIARRKQQDTQKQAKEDLIAMCKCTHA